MRSVFQLTQAYSQAPWRKQIALIGLFLLVVVFVALIAGVYLDVTARAATLGREVLLMQSDIDELEFNIANTQMEIARLSSVEEMTKRAEALGFIPIMSGDTQYVYVKTYVPRQTARIASQPTKVQTFAADLPPVYTESLIDWLQRNIASQRNRSWEVRP